MIIIFDFDKTFYSGEKVFENIRSWVEEHRRELFSNLTDSQYLRILNENPNFANATIGSEIVAGISLLRKKYPQLDIDTKDYWNCQQKYIYDINLTNAEIVDVEFINALTKLINCYIVSNSSPNHLNYYLGKIGLNSQDFKQVISNRFELWDLTKQHYYEDIAKQENAKTSEIYVFGDTYQDDLVPAEKIGANTCLITRSSLLKDNVIKCIKQALIKEPQLEQLLIEKYIQERIYCDSYIPSLFKKDEELCKTLKKRILQEYQILNLVGIADDKINEVELQEKK